MFLLQVRITLLFIHITVYPKSFFVKSPMNICT